MDQPTNNNQSFDGPGLGAMLRRNIPIVVMAILFIFYLTLYQFWDLNDYSNALKAALGLGLVIFIHELGHFLVAKWCDVHVETFSIGFGPPLPGCWFKYGETTYMLAVFPLGGYVKMVGEGDGEEDEHDPRSFKNKSVGQRMAIISAGVVMNIILGFACFAYVFMYRGAERIPGVVQSVEAGSPAWKLGTKTGNVIHQIGKKGPSPYFDDLQPEVMLSQEGEELDFKNGPPEVPADKLPMLKIVPRMEKKENKDKRPVIGIVPIQNLELLPARQAKARKSPVSYGSAASRANPPFEFGDRIVATTDPDKPDTILDLPIDPRDPNKKRLDSFEFQRRMNRLAGKEATVVVSRGEENPKRVQIKVPPAYQQSFGLRMTMDKIVGVREKSPAAAADVKAGDLIEQVEVAGPDGKTIRYVTDLSKEAPANVVERELDPIRLAHDLETWAQETKGDKKVKLTLVRPSKTDGAGHAERERVTLTLDWDDGWRFTQEVPLSKASPTSIPGLGLAYRVQSKVAGVVPGSAADKAGIQKDDIVVKYRYYMPSKSRPMPQFWEPIVERDVATRWNELEPDHWANMAYSLQHLDLKKLDFQIKSGKDAAIKEVSLTAEQDETWPVEDRGFIFFTERQLHQANSFGEALQMGVDRTVGFMRQIYLNLFSLFTGRISLDMLGGPITIGHAAFSIAGENMYQFLIFIGLISVNLAVINFLPIPVLDGGHMVFLIYESVFGRPMPVQIRSVATYVGLAMILSLMGYVIYLDLKRIWS